MFAASLIRKMGRRSSSGAASIIRDFAVVGLIISSSHACLATVLILSSPVLGEHLGGLAAAVLYTAWVGSCLLAPYYMPCLGSTRRALIVGLWGIAIYLASFAIAVTPVSAGLSLQARYGLVLGGAFFGGLALGPVFVCQVQALDHTLPKVAPELRLYFRRSTPGALLCELGGRACSGAR